MQSALTGGAGTWTAGLPRNAAPNTPSSTTSQESCDDGGRARTATLQILETDAEANVGDKRRVGNQGANRRPDLHFWSFERSKQAQLVEIEVYSSHSSSRC